MELHRKDEQLQPTDLVGCRYRLVQRRRLPGIAPTPASQQRAERTEEARQDVFSLLPRDVARVDARPEHAEVDTLEGLVNEASIITGAELTGPGWRAPIDALVRHSDGTYTPVAVSNHRVARPLAEGAKSASALVVDTQNLGLAEPCEANYKLRHHAVDSYRLALAARALNNLGVGSGFGAEIGQDREHAFLVRIADIMPILDNALAQPTPDHPRRVKECRSCRYWFDCSTQLEANDDISLLIPGDRADHYRERGITTVQELIDARLGDASILAAAWRAHIPALRRHPTVTAPRFDEEIDIDLEAYLDQGTYLWGTWDGHSYRPFVTWDGLGGDAEARNFASFWTWLMGRRADAARHGRSFAAFCYSAHGENHWMLSSARRFGGQSYTNSDGTTVTVPSETEVKEFISSGQWLDVFRLVHNQLAGPRGLGLKIIAPLAGFHWDEADLDGEASIEAYRVAAGLAAGRDVDKQEMRRRLLSYNGDDCRGTAAVRAWLAAGAPGTPEMNEL